MCIRDRLLEDPRDIAAGRARFVLVEERVVGMIGVADGVGPVSYTHLRAHETVLDIVCRLLLEKKKKQLTHMYERSTKGDIHTS